MQEPDDALGRRVDRGGDDRERLRAVDLLRQSVVETLSERLLQYCARIARLEDRLDVGATQFGDPRSVVQRLCRHVAGCLVALQLDNMHGRRLVESQEIDVPTMRRRDLTTDDEQGLAQDRWV